MGCLKEKQKAPKRSKKFNENTILWKTNGNCDFPRATLSQDIVILRQAFLNREDFGQTNLV